MSENGENLLPWQRLLRDSNPILQQSSTTLGIPAGENKTAKIGRVLFERIGAAGVLKTGSGLGSQGHQRSLRMVPLDRRQNFLPFLSTDHVPISRRF